jgi:hypothetical protein
MCCFGKLRSTSSLDEILENHINKGVDNITNSCVYQFHEEIIGTLLMQQMTTESSLHDSSVSKSTTNQWVLSHFVISLTK